MSIFLEMVRSIQLLMEKPGGVVPVLLYFYHILALGFLL